MNAQIPQNPFLEQEIDIREYLNVLYRHRRIIISITLIVCTLSLIHSFLMKPVYEATTNILIQREAPRIVNMQEVSPVEYTAREYYQTQYKILKSRSIAKMVNNDLGQYEPWSSWKGRFERKEPLTEKERITALLGVVEVRPIPNTQMVEIRAEDIDPQLAAKIADLWAENYISYVLDIKFDATQYASGWLQKKIDEAKNTLKTAELKLQAYRKNNKIIVAEVETSQEKVLDQLRERRAELELELSEKMEYYKDKHPEIIGIRSELSSVEEKIDREKQKDISVKDKSIEYNILKRDVDTNRQIYESLLKRIKETEVTGELKTTNIRVIDPATVPESPARPSKKKNLLIAFFLGIFGGSGLAFLFENLDQSIKTPEDIKNHVKLPCLASVAVPKDSEGEALFDPEFISSNKPKSTVSESYRALRTSIMFTAVEHTRKTLLFTSSGPQEGKTTTAINLATVMAQAGERTVLVDADLRQPRIEKVFKTGSDHGITEVLAGAEPLDSVIRQTGVENLDLITCGAIPPNPSELLGSRKMDEFLHDLEERYDRIIIDTPPVLAVTDAVVLSGKVDGAIIVVKAGETNRNAVQKTKEIIENMASSNLIGSILNMVETSQTGGYYYYHYYGKKYGHYGENTHKETSASASKS